jgi:transposase
VCLGNSTCPTGTPSNPPKAAPFYPAANISVENSSVTEATEEYGVSRPTYYQTRASFDKGGLAGLVPRKRGPHGPHKLQGEALAFVQQQLVAGQPVRARELAKLVRQKFDLAIHPRTIERSVAVKKTPR